MSVPEPASKASDKVEAAEKDALRYANASRVPCWLCGQVVTVVSSVRDGQTDEPLGFVCGPCNDLMMADFHSGDD